MTISPENKTAEIVNSSTEAMTCEDITANKDGGLLKEIIRQGSGDETPLAGDTVFVHYTGTLLDGTKFDSSRDRNEKFSFEVGKGSVIKGWDQGIPTMKRGELARFTIRADYGYGPAGSPPTIPPNATLIFEVELFDFHGEDISDKKDKSIIKRVITPGSGYTSPNEGARCVINLKGSLADGKVFDERNNVEFEIGEGSNVDVIEPIENALIKFKKDEKSRLAIKSKKFFPAKFNVPDHSEIVYEIELVSFEKAKESWQLNTAEKLEQSELLKNKGGDFFKAGNYLSALKKYNKIVDYLQSETFEVETEKETCSKLKLAANLNIAACCLKTKEYRQVIEACNKAIELDTNSEKAYFRMAQAYYGLTEFDDAVKYFRKVLEINPSNKDATTHIALSQQQLKAEKSKEKNLYAKMLSSMGK